MLDEWKLIRQWDLGGDPLDFPWHFVLDLTPDWTALRFRAEGRWTCFGRSDPCGPDGYPELKLDGGRLVDATSPAGALIGKLGGSSAARLADDVVFPIGSQCIKPLVKTRTILFIGLNGVGLAANLTMVGLKLDIKGLADPTAQSSTIGGTDTSSSGEPTIKPP